MQPPKAFYSVTAIVFYSFLTEHRHN